MNSKWTVDLNVRCKIRKLSEKTKTRGNLQALKLGRVLRPDNQKHGL